MMRFLPHIALALLLVVPAPLRANDFDTMHPGLNDFRPGIGNEFGSRWDPLGTPQDRVVPYSRIFPERSGFGERDLARDPQGACNSIMTNAPDATGRMAHWRATQCFDADGKSYILPGSQFNLGYY